MLGFWQTGSGAADPGAAYSETLGDGATTIFDVVHGLGTESIVVEAWSAGAAVDPTLLVLDVDTVRVTFPAAPALDDGLVVVLAAGGTVEGGLLQVGYDFYGPNTDNGLVPQNTAGAYAWSEDAVTANVQVFNFDQEPARWSRAVYAYWRVVWMPMSSSNGVRLVHADSGPTNITEIHAFSGLTDTAPTVSGLEVTTEFNALIAAGAWKQIGMQVKSDGSMHVYASRLDVVWETGGGGSSGAASPLTTKGDLYTYSTADARLPVGTDGAPLLADSTEATGLRWGTAAELVTSTAVRDAGRWEVVVAGDPAEAVTNEAGDDWLFTWIED